MVRLSEALMIRIRRLLSKVLQKNNRIDDNNNNDNNKKPSRSPKVAPKMSPLASSKQLLTSISNKAIAFTHKKKAESDDVAGGGFGDGGLWQRSILMGEKCQPPDFSGVIYYDSYGKQLSEMPPRSPRATPLHILAAPAKGGEAK
ncbi:hypothetical protein Scep_016529 [Stephania cephalantha]|uniref:Uncharacterized protein n=1 Tax=Stephania cephalantha TaxID=152367 RepID=A0AAP0NW06_9MAGN